MTSITDYVRNILDKNQFISENLRLGLLNTSQYARDIQAQVEAALYKKVKLQTIVTSLNRIKTELENKIPVKFVVDDIQLKYPISDIVYHKNLDNYQRAASLHSSIGAEANNFFNLIVGNTETNIFVNSKYLPEVLAKFENQKPLYVRGELAGVILKFDAKYMNSPGGIFQVISQVSMSGVNIIEVLSTYTEITIFVDVADSQKVIEILKSNFLNVQ